MDFSALKNVAEQLLIKLSNQGFEGFDPYDVKAHPAILKLTRWGNQWYPLAVVREIVFEFLYHYPEKARGILNVKPQVNAKALGLSATACLELSQLAESTTSTDSELGQLLKIGTQLDELLESQRQGDDKHWGWGYPFSWQSQGLIPAFTPNGIVTTAVGEYFWERYKISNTPSDLDKCVRIAQFLSELPKDRISAEEVCFSYVPHYQNHVHNLNLFVADYLIKTGLASGNKTMVETGHHAVNYTLNQQREDGAFDYNGPPEPPQNFVDNYHTGFVLRMLGSIYSYTKREDVRESLHRGLEFYLTNFFKKNGAPKFTPERTHRIDIHSAAESINCLITLHDVHPDAISTAEKVLAWTMDHFYDAQEGDFYYAFMKSRFTGRAFRSEIKYTRWSQAWMLRALSRYLLFREQQRVIL